MITYKVHTGLIWENEVAIPVQQADKIAKANGQQYAEHFVETWNDKIIQVDPESYIITYSTEL